MFDNRPQDKYEFVIPKEKVVENVDENDKLFCQRFVHGFLIVVSHTPT